MEIKPKKFKNYIYNYFNYSNFYQIFSEKLEINAAPKVEAFNPDYKPSGGKVQVINLDFSLFLEVLALIHVSKIKILFF
jgi:hypothetical protein